LIDAGDIPANGEKFPFEFSFVNRGATPLRIESVQADCSCMNPEYTKEEVPPGGSGHVILRYAIPQSGGRFMHDALVKTNDPSCGDVVVTAAGNTDSSVIVSPLSFEFGPVATRSTATVVLTSAADQPFKIIDATADSPNVTLTWRGVTRELFHKLHPAEAASATAPKNSFIVQAVLVPDHNGIYGNTVVHVHTNIKGFDNLSIPVHAIVVDPIRAFPSEIVLTASQTETHPIIRLVASDGQSIRISAVNTEGTGLSWVAPSHPAAATLQRLEFSWDPVQRTALTSSISIQVRTADETSYSLSIPIRIVSEKRL
jgi:hypothetical protein